jgi:hypothetical protein
MFQKLNIRQRLMLAFGLSALLVLALGAGSALTIRMLNNNMRASGETIQANIGSNVANLQVNQTISELTSSILAAQAPEALVNLKALSAVERLRRDNRQADIDWSVAEELKALYDTKLEFLGSEQSLEQKLRLFLEKIEKFDSSLSRSLAEVAEKNFLQATEMQDTIAQKTQSTNDQTLEELGTTVKTTLEDVVQVLQLRSKVLELDLKVREYLRGRTPARAVEIRNLLTDIEKRFENIPENVAGPFEVMAYQGSLSGLRDLLIGAGGIIPSQTENPAQVNSLREGFAELDGSLLELAENTVFDGTAELSGFIDRVSGVIAESLTELIQSQVELNKTFRALSRLESLGSRINRQLFTLVIRIQSAALDRTPASRDRLRTNATALLQNLRADKASFQEVLVEIGEDSFAADFGTEVENLIKELEGPSGTIRQTAQMIDQYTESLAASSRIENSLATTSQKLSSSFESLVQSTAGNIESTVALGRKSLTGQAIGVVVIVLAAISMGIFIGLGISKRLGAVVENLFALSDRLSHNAASLSHSSEEQATVSSEQAASLEESSSTLEEISSMAAKNADAAKEAAQMASAVQEAAGAGTEKMKTMSSAMDEINKASDQVSHIIRTIDEIAFQTNILALNAAVEAARAGEAGAGFAVVADEVRALAMKAKNAAQETEDIIAKNATRTKQGVTICASVSDSLTTIRERIGSLDKVIAGIAEATQEQSQGLEQINRGLSESSSTTQKNAALAEQGASSSQELNAESRNLLGMVKTLSILSGIDINSNDGARSASHLPSSRGSFAQKEKPKALASAPDEYDGHPHSFLSDDDDSQGSQGRFLS